MSGAVVKLRLELFTMMKERTMDDWECGIAARASQRTKAVLEVKPQRFEFENGKSCWCWTPGKERSAGESDNARFHAAGWQSTANSRKTRVGCQQSDWRCTGPPVGNLRQNPRIWRRLP